MIAVLENITKSRVIQIFIWSVDSNNPEKSDLNDQNNSLINFDIHTNIANTAWTFGRWIFQLLWMNTIRKVAIWNLQLNVECNYNISVAIHGNKISQENCYDDEDTDMDKTRDCNAEHAYAIHGICKY